MTELKAHRQSCELNTLRDSLIRDMIVIGIKNNGLRENLLQDADLSLDTAITKCRAKEQTKQQAMELAKSSSTNVDVVILFYSNGGLLTMYSSGHFHAGFCRSGLFLPAKSEPCFQVGIVT